MGVIEKIKPEIDKKALARTFITIHNKIHHPAKPSVMLVDNERHYIKIYRNNCRYLKYKDILFMEQNPKKESIYAEMARNGDKITWGIRNGTWIYIKNGKIERGL